MEEQKETKVKNPKTNWTKALAAVNVLLLIIAVFALLQVSKLKKELKSAQGQVRVENPNQKELDFALLFIDKVLQSDQEVDFETRLQLENAVRALNDKDILFQWQKFTSAKNEKDAQTEVKNLLRLVIAKAESN